MWKSKKDCNATSIAAGSGSLHYGLLKRQGCRQASWIPSVTFTGCLQRELSWRFIVFSNDQTQCGKAYRNKKLFALQQGEELFDVGRRRRNEEGEWVKMKKREFGGETLFSSL
ncbi:hypothetical protein Ddye_014010 [Dipteronia dyeriana]|uniref:Uncharacterized protein n=1 Tax=Dipteronia dyeriana TaxID=168575 RepID=A0AAD9X7C4_9ROSI|nr:hypothetical protein Ddye_014010 [Dipteronia dyeriana]